MDRIDLQVNHLLDSKQTLTEYAYESNRIDLQVNHLLDSKQNLTEYTYVSPVRIFSQIFNCFSATTSFVAFF